jgi:predicted RNA-binding Zn-ribbon protein involved in translation (DUF1610 family)
MADQCPKCGTQLASPWSFCPHCGAAITHETQQLAPPPEQEHIPARGAFGGLLFGMLVAPILVISGTMLCLTGWGIFLGIPMILAGIFAPLAGPLFGMGEYKGKCPSCGTAVISKTDGQSYDCPTCNKTFAVRSRKVASAH